MAKPELEYQHPPEGPWSPVAGIAGLDELILSRDESTGDCTRLLRYAPGTDTSSLGALAHDFWEEAWIVSGAARDAGSGVELQEGMYACRPPGMAHGPFVSREGCVMLEVRYRSR